jgi:dienelactone hydrolase
VLLLHEAQKDHCRWMPFARALAARGVQVWSVDSSASSNARSVGANGSVDPSQDLIRMAAYVREHGASEVVLAGASMGGVGAIVAAGPAKALRVATLSAPTDYNVDAVPAARKLTVPVLFMAGDDDGDFAKAADTLAAAAKATAVTRVNVPTADHGTDMLADPVPDLGGRPVAAILSTFLTE